VNLTLPALFRWLWMFFRTPGINCSCLHV
jgi:hypothetical protein